MRAAAIGVVLSFTTVAFARAQNDVPYGQAEVFSTAVRFIVIERKCKVTEKDGDAAFVNFECTDEGKTKRGAMEIFASPSGGRSVRVQVTLGDDPHYMESRFLELFERKLREERGSPPPPPRAPDKKPPDGGT